MSSYVNCLGGRCPHMPFFIGGHMSGGENVLHSFNSMSSITKTTADFVHFISFKLHHLTIL